MASNIQKIQKNSKNQDNSTKKKVDQSILKNYGSISEIVEKQKSIAVEIKIDDKPLSRE